MLSPNTIPSEAYVIIIGAMKAGTSSLFNLLGQHPRICASDAKEPEFFSEHQGHAVAGDSYERFFQFDEQAHRYCLEASTGYAKYPQEIGVPQRMKEYGIAPRFIYVVRDPVDRIYSHLNYARMNNHAWAESSLSGFYAVALSMYYTQLRQFLDVYPDTSRYFIADFNDLKNNPSGLATDIFEWLDLDPVSLELEGPVNVTPPRSSLELRLTRSPIHRLRGILPAAVRQRLKNALRAHGTPAGQELSELDRRNLHEWLEPDMLAFGRRFGFPVENWGFDGAHHPDPIRSTGADSEAENMVSETETTSSPQ